MDSRHCYNHELIFFLYCLIAAVGYDSNMMYLASYDWRLSYSNLEVRDNFFTKLKIQIELNMKLHGKKTVVMAHSMGE